MCRFLLSFLLTLCLLFLPRTHNLPGVSPSKDDDYICTGVSIGDLSPDKVKLNISQSLTPLPQPDCLRCLLLCPWPRRSRDQGAPHDPQQVQEAQKKWIRRHLGLPASCHVQRPGGRALLINTDLCVCPSEQDIVCLGKARSADRTAERCRFLSPA